MRIAGGNEQEQWTECEKYKGDQCLGLQTANQSCADQGFCRSAPPNSLVGAETQQIFAVLRLPRTARLSNTHHWLTCRFVVAMRRFQMPVQSKTEDGGNGVRIILQHAQITHKAASHRPVSNDNQDHFSANFCNLVQRGAVRGAMQLY